MPLQVGVGAHLIALQAPIPVAIELPEQLAQPLLVVLQFIGRPARQGRTAHQGQQQNTSQGSRSTLVPWGGGCRGGRGNAHGCRLCSSVQPVVARSGASCDQIFPACEAMAPGQSIWVVDDDPELRRMVGTYLID